MPRMRGTCLDDPWAERDNNFEANKGCIYKNLFDNFMQKRIESLESTARQLMFIDATIVGVYVALATNNIGFSAISRGIRSYFTNPYMVQNCDLVQLFHFHPFASSSVVVLIYASPIIFLILGFWLSVNNLKKSFNNSNFGKKGELDIEMIPEALNPKRSLLRILLKGPESMEEKEDLFKYSNYLTVLGIGLLFIISIFGFGLSIYDNNVYGEKVLEFTTDGNILNGLGIYENASLAFDKALMINPEYAPAWEGKAEALSGLGKYDESLEAFNVALSIDPNNIAAWINKGLVLERLNESELAIKHYEQAKRIDPTNGIAWFNIGNVLEFSKGDHKAALDAYNNAIEKDPNNANAYYNKGLVLSKQNNSMGALQAFDKAIEIDPNHILALNARGKELNKLKRNEEANKSVSKANEIKCLKYPD
jgi:tetratricopeptide (TPR) repeat protein